MCILRWSMIVVTFACLGSVVCVAQQDAGGIGEPEALDANEARRVTVRHMQSIGRFDAVTIRVTTRMDMKFAEGAAPEERGMFAGDERWVETLVYEHPMRFRLTSEHRGVEVVSDGRTIIIASESYGQFVRKPLPPAADLSDFIEEASGGLLDQIPMITGLIRRDEPAEALVDERLEFMGIRRAEVNGRPGTWVYAVFDGVYKMRTWHSDADGLVERYEIDTSEWYGYPGAPFESVVMRTDCEYEELAAPVDPMRFEIDTSAMKEVDSIDPYEAVEGREAAQLQMIGKPAPDFTLTGLDGGDLSLADLRGKVVVLDFWATWCGPCLMAMPELEKVHKRFEGRPVVVLGVNTDRAGMEDAIRSAMEQRGATFGQVLDPKGTASRSFAVSGIPHGVLIDADGVVRDVHVGFSPDMAEKYTDQIERLLRGERLFTDEELAERIAQARDESEEGFGFAGVQRLEIAPHESHRLKANYTASDVRWRMASANATVDYDGDGLDEVVVVGMGGRLVVLGANGEPMHDITLKGLGRSSMTQAVTMLRAGGERRWGVMAARGGVGGSTIAIMLFDDTGALVATVDHGLPRDSHAQAFAAACDLTGDGRDELVLALSVASFSAHYDYRAGGCVIVADSEGRLLSRYPVGQMVHGMRVARGEGVAAIIVFTDEGVQRLTFE